MMKKHQFQKLDLPVKNDRPYYYTSFVSTLDGKVFVKKPNYWPIGSHTDYAYFTWLRAHADAIVDGTGTAQAFGEKTIETIHSKEFLSLRNQAGKHSIPAYIIVTNQSDYLQKHLQKTLQKYTFQPYFYSSKQNLTALGTQFKQKGFHHIFIDGGPTLIGSFIKENLLDEIFLTISPKIFGSEKDQTLTMVEGTLFKPEKIPTWNLVSVKKIASEVFLRYKKEKLL